MIAILVVGQASGEEFPGGGGFNGMSIRYAFSGVTLDAPTDESDFTTTRYLNGRFGGRKIGMSFTLANNSIGSKYRCSLAVSVNNQSYLSRPNIGTPFSVPTSVNLELDPSLTDPIEYVASIYFHPTYWGGFNVPRILVVRGFLYPNGPTETLVGSPATPRRDQKGVEWNRPAVLATFSDELLQSSVNENTVFLRYKNGGQVIKADALKVQGASISCRPLLSAAGRNVEVVVKGGLNGVRGKKGGRLSKDLRWSFSTVPQMEVRVVPVQVAEDAVLVKGRPGVVRVEATWPVGGASVTSDVDSVDALVSVLYDQGRTVQRSWKFFRTPYLAPAAQRKVGNSANFYSEKGEVPILDQSGEHSIVATVIPVDAKSSRFSVTTPVTVKSYFDGWTGADDAFDILYLPLPVGGWSVGQTVDIGTMAGKGSAMMQKFLPVRSVRNTVHQQVADIPYNSTGPSALAVASLLANLAKFSGLTYWTTVGVVPRSWISSVQGASGVQNDFFYLPTRSCLVANDIHNPGAGYLPEPYVLGHEVGHALGLLHPADRARRHETLRGYDISQDLCIQYASTYDTELMYEDISFTGTRLNRIWMDGDCYRRLAARLTYAPLIQSLGKASVNMLADVGGDQPVLLVSGVLAVTSGVHSAQIDPVYPLDAGSPSENGTNPLYTVELQSAIGDVLVVRSVDPQWYTQPNGDTYAPLSLEFPWTDEAARVVVRRGGTLLAQVVRSSAAPTVQLTTPSNGSILTGAVVAAWSGADANGDWLRYTVSASSDGGHHWVPLILETTNTSAVVDSSQFPNGTSCLVRVLASDGFNSGGATGGVLTVRNPVRVLSLNPEDGNTNASPTAPIEVTFRDVLDVASLTSGVVSVTYGTNGLTLAGVLSYDDTTSVVRLTPATALPWDTACTGRVRDVVCDRWGNTPTGDVVWTFRTEPDRYAPEIFTSAPLPGDIGIPLDQAIYITFTESISETAITNGAIRLLTAGGATVPATLTGIASNTTVMLVPTVALQPEATYSVQVDEGVTDLAANPLATNMSWSFTTGEGLAAGMRILAALETVTRDTSGDGYADELVVRLEVEVPAADEYLLSGSWVMTNGATLADSMLSTNMLSPGRQQAELVFRLEDVNRVLNPVCDLMPVGMYANSAALRSAVVYDSLMRVAFSNDVDADGMLDDWERQYGLNPLNASDARDDADGDGLPNGMEYANSFNPGASDSDGDSLPDSWELVYGNSTNHAVPARNPALNVAVKSVWPAQSAVYGVAAVSNTAYVCDAYNGLHVLDVTVVTNPVRLGTCDTPGSAKAVAVVSNLALVADNSALQIIDVTAPSNPVILSQKAPPNSDVYDVCATGTLAYTCGSWDNLHVVDYSVPGTPVSLYATNTGINGLGLTFAGSKVYVADGAAGLRIFDVSVPSNPVLQGTYYSGETFYKVAVAGNYAYLACGLDGVRIVDISTPTNPVFCKAFLQEHGAYYVVMQGGYLFAGYRDKLSIFDMANPAYPVLAATCAVTWVENLFADERRLYVAQGGGGMQIAEWQRIDADGDGMDDVWENQYFNLLTNTPAGDADHDGISNWGEFLGGFNPTNADQDADGVMDGVETGANLTDPRHPGLDRDGDGFSDEAEVNTYHTNPQAADSDGDGLSDRWEIQYGFNPWSRADAVLDPDHDGLDNLAEYSNGTSPLLADQDGDTLPDGWEYAHGLTANHAPDPYPGLGLIQVGSLPVASASHFELAGRYLYVAEQYDGVGIYDLSSPTNPVFVGRIAGAHDSQGLCLESNALHVADGYYGYSFYSLDQPTNPVWRGTVAGEGSLYPYKVAGGGARVCVKTGSSSGQMTVIDVSQPTNPVVLGAPLASIYSLCTTGLIAYAGVNWDGLNIVDLAGPQVLPKRSWRNSNESYSLWLAGDRLYNASSYGIDVYDASVATNPVYLGTTNLGWATTYDVAACGSTVCAAMGYSGIKVLSVTNSTNFNLVASWDNPVNIQAVRVVTNYVYALEAYTGLRIFELAPLDQDGDRMPDSWELQYFASLTNGTAGDFDHDGISNWGEFLGGLNPTNSDQNADGLNDGVDVSTYGIDPRASGQDVDGDGLSDEDEVMSYHTNPAQDDTDGDGMEDGIELSLGLNPLNPADGGQDPDHDRLTNAEEVGLGGGINQPDSDGDGLPDGWEVLYGQDPLQGAVAIDDVELYLRSVVSCGGAVSHFRVVSNLVYFVDGVQLGVCDISVPTNPVLRATVNTGGTPVDIEVVSNLVWVSDHSQGLMVYDVTTATNPVFITNLVIYADSLVIVSNYAYVSDHWNWGLNVVDVRDPSDLRLGSRLFTDNRFTDLQADATHLFASGWYNFLGIYDLANPTNPVFCGSVAGEGYGVNVTSNTAFVAAGAAGLKIIDVSTPASPALLSTMILGAPVRATSVRGDYAFVAVESAGIQCLDIRAATTPVLVGSVPMDQLSVLNVWADAGRVVASGASGIAVLNDQVMDSDRDGLYDWWEQQYLGGLAYYTTNDADGDGVFNIGEYLTGLNPTNSDTDADGLMDGSEVALWFTDPWSGDSDSDGVEDGEEVNSGADGYQTNPLKSDSDEDGLSDYDETHPAAGDYASSPMLTDTDGDGVLDVHEFIAGSNPRDASDYLGMRMPVQWGQVIQWRSSSNRLYTLDRSTNLLSGWQTLSSGLQATPPVNTYTDSPPAAVKGGRYYRVHTSR